MRWLAIGALLVSAYAKRKCPHAQSRTLPSALDPSTEAPAFMMPSRGKSRDHAQVLLDESLERTRTLRDAL